MKWKFWKRISNGCVQIAGVCGLMNKHRNKWIATRNEFPCGTFDNRKEAVKWLKGLLKQTLQDFKNQDKTDEFDYPIDLRSIKIFPVRNREVYLGL